jgi:tape measure domain-containing protein
VRAATFTTYINAQNDPGLEAAWSKNTNLATSSYATITKSAQEATRATAGLLSGGKSTAGGQAANKQISDRVAATKAVTVAAASAERASARLTSAVRSEGAAAASAAKNNQALARGLATTATALNVVQGPLGPLAGRLGAVGRAVTELSGARLGLAAFGAGLFAIGRVANNFQNIESRLRPLYGSQRQVNSALDDVVGIATRARSSLEPIVDLYIRLNAAGKDVGISAVRSARLTELAAKAATLSGGSAQSQEAGLGQFAQAIGSNNLGGDELRSVKENTFALAQAIAQGFQNADGSIGTTIGNLKKLGTEGKLSAEVVAKALENSQYRIELAFSRLPKTLSSAGQEFKTQTLLTVGRFDSAIGFTSKLAQSLSIAAIKVVPVAQNAVSAVANAVNQARAVQQGTFVGPLRGKVGEAARAKGAADAANAEAIAAENAARRQVAGSEAVIAVRQQQLAISREIYAQNVIEANQAVTGTTARTAGLERNLAGALAEQEAVRATTAAEVEATRVDLAGKTAQLEASRAVVLQRRAELTALTDIIVAEESRVLATQRAGQLLARNTTLQPGVQSTFIAANTAEQERAQLALSRATVLSQRAALDLAIANEALVQSQRAVGLATRSANESASVGIRFLREAEAAALGAAAAQRALADATAAATAAQARTSTAALTAATNNLANSSGRAGFAFLRQAEATAALNVATATSTITQRAATVAQAAFSSATAIATRLVGAIGSSIKIAASALFSFNAILAIATTAMLLYATATSAADEGMQRLKLSQDDVSARFAKIASNAANASNEVKAFARTKILSELGQDRDAAEAQYAAARKKVAGAQAAAALAGDTETAARLGKIGQTINSRTNLAGAASAISEEAKRSPQYFRRNTVAGFQVGEDTRAGAIINSLATADTAASAFNARAKAARESLDQISGRGPKPAAAGTIQTKAQLDAAARAAANLGSTNPLKAAAGRRDTALQALETQFPKGGATPEAQQQYLAARQQIVESYNGEVAGIAAARKAASAGAVAARKEARDRLQDAKDQAAATRDAALLSLTKSGKDPKGQEFLLERQKILQTYDDEVNKLDASAAASSSAASQQIADAKAVAAAAVTAGEKRADILGSYDDAPKAIDKARDQIQDLNKLIGTAVNGIADITKDNPLGTGIYTPEMAQADRDRIEYGLGKPLRDLQRDYQRGIDVASLQLQGRDAEATALGQRNQLLDAGSQVLDADYQRLIRNAEAEQRINDALASRGRVVSAITGALDTAREGFTDLISGASGGGAKAGLAFLKSFQTSYTKIAATQLTEKLFAGADEKVRGLLTGRSKVDQSIAEFGTRVDTMSGSTTQVKSGFEKVANAADALSTRLDNAVLSGGAEGGASGVLANALGTAANDTPLQGASDEIVVAGKRLSDVALYTGQLVKTTAIDTSGLYADLGLTKKAKSTVPSAKSIYNEIGAGVGAKFDGIVNKVFGRKTTTDAAGNVLGGSQFFSKIGKSFGTALEGAGQGAFASSIAKAVGIKQSKTGAQIGGAIGSFVPIPGGAFIGGLIGGTVGGLFKKTKQASSTLGVNSYGELEAGAAVGTGKESRAQADALGGNVVSGLQSIADQLGGKVSGGGSVSIGYRPGHKAGAYRVDTSGQGKLTGVQAFDTEQEAVQYAIADALKDGVIAGISDASKKILASGQDLTKALNKALVIESIPKRLLQLTDPVKYAVSNLNDEFTKMISYLKEGGATAEQFADAQKLYDLERAEAIKQATNQAASAIDDFLKNMVGGSASPLNKRTTYDNAASELDKFKSDIASGKTVDQNDLLSAARNFQDASRSIFGSSQSFFNDFNDLRALLTKARDNAGITDVTNLPASPFGSASTDSGLTSALSSLRDANTRATADSTDALISKLGEVVTAIQAGSYGGSDRERISNAISSLPGFATM